MDKRGNLMKIIGLGLIAAVAAILLINWLSGLGVTSTELDVDNNGNLTEIDE